MSRWLFKYLHDNTCNKDCSNDSLISLLASPSAQYQLSPATMKLINIKILIISILCSLLIFIKVKKLMYSLENYDNQPLASKVFSNKTQFTPKNSTLWLEDQMSDFSERRRHIADMCGKYKADIGETQLIEFRMLVGRWTIRSIKDCSWHWAWCGSGITHLIIVHIPI